MNPFDIFMWSLAILFGFPAVFVGICFLWLVLCTITVSIMLPIVAIKDKLKNKRINK